MEEILASIRRIIADEDTGKAKPAASAPAAVAPAPPPPKPAPVPPPVAAKPAPMPAPPPPPKPPEIANNQADIDAMLASVDVAPPPPPKPVAPPAADVLDLTEAMTAAPAPAQSFRTIDAASDIVFAENAAEPAPEPPRAPVQPPPALDRGLMSNVTRSAVDHAFNSLANTVLGNNARTLEDLVKEMLRPMLKSWLDDNLPGLVERIVRAEIERVSRGGR